MKIEEFELYRVQAYVDGAWIDADGGRRVEVRDPASGEVIATVPRLGEAETRRAIGAAHAALPAWRGRLARDRCAIVRRFGALMMEHQEELARLMTAEQGKPLAESRGEVAYAASFFEFFAEEGSRVYGEIIPAHREGLRVVSSREAVGVCAAVTPWNFPSAMITRKLAPALVVGCTMVAKPAEATPLSALALAELGARAGLPAGVFNVVTGAAEDAPVIGRVLSSDPRVRKLSFTGSTKVGKLLYAQCASTVKRVSLELGGNAPFIVFNDADVEAAVEGAMVAKFRNSGQTCVAANRIYVQEGIYDAFRDALAEAIRGLQVGSGLEEGVSIGPMIDEAARRKVEEHLEDARQRGARVVVGGEGHPRGGSFVTPTLLEDVDPSMLMCGEETFGPLAGLSRFQSEEEVVQMANATPAGLAAYFYSRDVGRVFRVSEALEYGMVGVNTGLVSTATAPFGGIKESGLGREGSHHGIDAYTEIKYMCMGMN